MIVREDECVFVDNASWDQLEALLSPEIRAHYDRYGYPYASTPNGMHWIYVPLEDSLGKKIPVFSGGQEAKKQYREALYSESR